MGPRAEIELVLLDVGAAQLLVLGPGLIDLAGVDLDRDVGVLEAAHARPRDVGGEPHPDRVARRGPRQVEAGVHGVARGRVALAAELELPRVGRQIEAAALAGPQGETRQIDAVICRRHLLRSRLRVSAQFHLNPDTYLDRIRAEVPRYDELQERTIEAIPFPPRRVLELGVGTGETARRLLARYPDAELTGLDSQPEMVFKARELGIEVRLARMEDPLPDGPWDLVISVLSVHHLDRGAEARPVSPRARAVAGDGDGRRGDRRTPGGAAGGGGRPALARGGPGRVVRRRDRLGGRRPGGDPRRLRTKEPALGGLFRGRLDDGGTRLLS